jgi:hypothetical protein
MTACGSSWSVGVTGICVRNRLAEVRDSLGDVHMNTPASAIFASARKRYARRAIAAVAAACAAIGLAVVLTLPAGSQTRPVHVHLAAWLVDTNPNGTVTFTMKNTSYPAQLERALAQAGVPAMIRWGEVCLARGRHVLLPIQGIVRVTGATFTVNGIPTHPGSVFLLMGGNKAGKPLNWSWTVVPFRIPNDARFVISAEPSDRVSPDHIQAAWELVLSSAPVTCATSAKP